MLLSKHELSMRKQQVIYWTSLILNIAGPRKRRGIFVLGHVKSGTNWLCRLLSDILEVPILEPWKMNLPAGGPWIFHMHRFIPLSGVKRRSVYILRDGRDIVVSAYFNLVREARGHKLSRAEKLLGRPLQKDNIRENLPQFIEFMARYGLSGPNYKKHIELWAKDKRKFTTVRYEDLLVAQEQELARVCESIVGKKISSENLKRVIEKNSFSNRTGRKPGVAKQDDFIRKGISGDWKNYFTREAALVFDRYNGDALICAGYESDHSWVEGCSFD